MYLIMISMTLMTIILMFMKHPLSMGLILLIQTISISLMTGLMNCNFWYSYILFIIMIGGMLILFLYMTSIASNEKFKFSPNLLIFLLISYMILIIMTPDISQFYINLMMPKENMLNQPIKSLNKYFNYPNNYLMMMMFIYLFIVMIMTTKLTKSQSGPLRQKK